MSSEHLTKDTLEGYLTRTLKPGDLLLADRHLQLCGECLGKAAEQKQMQEAAAILNQAQEWEADLDLHLSYEQLEALADGTMDEVSREIVEVHTAACSSCLDQINDLRELREAIERPTQGQFVTVPAAAGFWERIAASITIRAAFTAAALIAVLGIGLWAISRLTAPGPLQTVLVEEAAPADPASQLPAEIRDQNLGSGEVAGVNEPADRGTGPVVSLVDGGSHLEMDQYGNIIGIDAGRFEGRLKAVLTRQDVQVSPAARELRSASGVLMGGDSPGNPFALTAPVGKVIASDQPQFAWRSLEGAESYVVTVYDERFAKIAESPALNQNSWRPPVRLKRGAVYSWQVSANKAGQEIKSPVRPAPDAKFKIIDAAAASDIEAARRTGSHLLLGTVYANAGMAAEAEREFQMLLTQNPRSELAKKLLRKVQSSK